MGASSRLPFVLLLAALAAFAVLADDYGQSTDDEADARFGADSLLAYLGSAEFLTETPDRVFYGPVYWMLSAGLVEAIQTAGVNAAPVHIRHGLNAATFLVAVASVYTLTGFLGAGRSSALLAAALFGLQPLLFGHAFINQKDTPFMALFAVAVTGGLAAVRQGRRRPPPGLDLAAGGLPAEPIGDRAAGPSMWRMLSLIAGTLLALGVAVDLLRRGWIYRGLLELVGLAYRQAGPEWVNAWLAGAAEGGAGIPLAAYTQKVALLYGWTSVLGSVAALAAAVIWAAIHLPRLRASLTGGCVSGWPGFALAGFALGMAISTRVAGILAGALVMAYALVRPSRRTAVGLAIYCVTAATVAFLTWPYLWLAPIRHLRKSIQLMMDFPPHLVLFDGAYLASDQLPASYLPRLLAAQLTEPALLLIALGIGLAIIHLSRRRAAYEGVLVMLAWLFIPAVYVIARQPSIYNNFRQLLFVLPPAFVLAGLAIEWGFSHVTSSGARLGLASLILLPGLIGIVRLHPYEYIYYNSTVGGVGGAAGRFELDYWCTSYREAMEQVNRAAPANARIAVGPPVSTARTFARPDLHVATPFAFDEPAFTLVCDYRRGSAGVDLTQPVLHRVSIAGASLAEIRLGASASSEGGSP